MFSVSSPESRVGWELFQCCRLGNTGGDHTAVATDQGWLLSTNRPASRSSQTPSPPKVRAGGSLRRSRGSRETLPGEQGQEKTPEQQGEGQREEGKPVCMSKQGWGWENQPSEGRQVRRWRSQQQGLPLAQHSFQASFGLLKTSLRGNWSILPLRDKKPGEGQGPAQGPQGPGRGRWERMQAYWYLCSRTQAHRRQGCGQTGPRRNDGVLGRPEPHAPAQGAHLPRRPQQRPALPGCSPRRSSEAQHPPLLHVPTPGS